MSIQVGYCAESKKSGAIEKKKKVAFIFSQLIEKVNALQFQVCKGRNLISFFCKAKQMSLSDSIFLEAFSIKIILVGHIFFFFFSDHCLCLLFSMVTRDLFGECDSKKEKKKENNEKISG